MHVVCYNLDGTSVRRIILTIVELDSGRTFSHRLGWSRGLIIATIVNIFVKSSGFGMILNYLGVLIFVGLTAWDTQKIKQMLSMAEDTGETAQKVALMGALSLYLDFINLFIHLLRIMGNNRN